LVKTRRGQFDHLIIETSGLADPGPVAALFWCDEDLDLGLSLNGIVAVVEPLSLDAVHGKFPQELVAKQLALADMILLNKANMTMQRSHISGCRAQIQRLNSEAPIFETQWALEVEISDILTLNSLSDISLRHRTLLQDNCVMTFPDASSVGSITVEFASDIEFSKLLFDRRLGSLLWSEGKPTSCEIWRVKGLVHLRDQPETRFVYQAVGDIFEGQEAGPWPAEPITKLIFIGKNLVKERITNILKEAIAP